MRDHAGHCIQGEQKMNSEPETRLRPKTTGTAAFAALFLAIALPSLPVRAEDPLLGTIRVIKCVGCDPGAVNLIIHDPIDVRDFEVQIKESDYQKIVTPLAGKTVFDKEGCFYWMDVPKNATPPVSKDPAKEPAKDGTVRDGDKKPGKKGMKKEDASAPADSAKSAPKEGLLETSAPPLSPAPEGKPSRCIPFVRIEPKITPHKGGKKDDE
ncbi:MAG: hypothetical protein JWP91_3245 [Fibrobacteres bacterium]|nr:hypothetical protein [Fibrobacterota bacterium]